MTITTGASNSIIKNEVEKELENKGSGGPWLWKLFFLCVTPNILNGFHVFSYVFIGQMPDDYYCLIPELIDNGWSHSEIRNITTNGEQSCKLINWNYQTFENMSFEDAFSYTQSVDQQPAASLNCKDIKNSFYYYQQEDKISIVPEWNLVCENKVLRTTVQVALSIGKFVGASTFGIFSDKFGRRKSLLTASLIFMASGLLTSFSPWYYIFLLGRIGLGFSGSGLFYTGFTLLTENISAKHRSWMSIAFSMSYPIGMLILAMLAYLIHPWRYLQLALSIPALLLFVVCYVLFESPRWLLSKGRNEEAYRVVFGNEKELPIECYQISKDNDNNLEQKGVTTPEKMNNKNLEVNNKKQSGFLALYGTPKIRRCALICYFTWCVTSLSYYITALNADNFAANRYLYVAITGSVDIPSYIVSIIALKYMGRRITSCLLFTLAGISLLSILAVPKEHIPWLVLLTMMGRFGISAVYAVMTLHTAEMFPTQIRNSALGTSSTMAHVGSITAPYIVDLLGLVAWFIPTTISGSTILLAGLLTLLLPETKNQELKDHITNDKEANDNTEK